MVDIVKGKKYNDIKPALANLSEKWLKEGKQYFGTAGVSLKNQITDPKYREEYGDKINFKAIEAGIAGEQATSKLLRKWILDKPDMLLIDSISLPNKDETVEEEEGNLDLGDTDHVLLCGDNIIIIDSKNWKSKASYQVDENGTILRGKKPFIGSNTKTRQCYYLWNKYFEDYEINKVYSFICIADSPNRSPEDPVSPFILRDISWWRAGFKLVNQETLLYFLDKEYEEMTNKGFNRIDLLATVLTGLTREYDVIGEKWPALKRKFG